MTVLVGVIRDNKAVLAADKMASCWHWSFSVDKMASKRKIHMAFTGGLREGQVIQHFLELPPRHEDHTDDSYIADICEAIRKLLKEKECKGTVALLVIGVGSKIYSISSVQCFISSETFIAEGCGNDIATGALEVLYSDKNLSVEEVATKAVEIASKRSLYCGKGVDLKIIDLL
ncbi:hypothetical protein [Vibrio phage JSF12]|uniref:Uncharacterized protein n=3 Tax=Jesfedecavirus TaxID=2560156 RepID=A0A2D0YLQ8_9CAUD|nr:peptidase HslV family [Vibrio phage phi 3]YP_009618436.1 peptidase HslV family [Vibrio phage JSF10]YP_009794703.1 peptidase HslV family [Vibrio phage JSF12]AJF40843.1 hypothetical protein SBVP3_0076 [Vibrio phage phi 3]ASV43409.1 hypothetical protein [Vibrio phage JSF10]ASV43538.1 hypothetical protein [Vibrio phage JSF12]